MWRLVCYIMLHYVESADGAPIIPQNHTDKGHWQNVTLCNIMERSKNNHTYIMLHYVTLMTWAEYMGNPTQNLDVTLCNIM